MWKEIEGFEGMYAVDESGRVKSLPRQVAGPYNSTRMLKEKELKPWVASGYLRVTLRKDRKETFAAVHRLVAAAFLPNPNNLNIVNHKDGDKLNNSASNLEWCTYSENMRHAFKNGLNGPHSLLSYKEVVDILNRKFQGQRAGYVYQSYKDKISKPGFYSVWGGYSYTKIYNTIQEEYKNE